jgi:cation diffusion facilitator CzcD-associated flavoprotein CzcO
MRTATPLLVIGAGPYGLSTAALARRRGIETVVLGHPMSFWRQHMPKGMFLRSGSDWHLDGDGVHTLEAYLEERGIDAGDIDPIPVGLFLDYAEWFERAEGIEVRPNLVTDVAKLNGGFEAVLDNGDLIDADAVVAAPGIAHFTNFPEWANALPREVVAHSCDLVRFDQLSGARVLIVGGRQSAYEWAALIGEQGAAQIHIVHRHDVPRFEQVSWKFVDAYIESTLQVRGWWRHLPTCDQEAIGRQFWEVGRLTLEPWLTSRLARGNICRRPGTEVLHADASNEEVTVRLSDGENLVVDMVVLATGYRVDIDRVPYLAGVGTGIERADGFPVLDEAFAALPGLYIPGFAATRDFGPFFGFVKGTPAAARLIVEDLLLRH